MYQLVVVKSSRLMPRTFRNIVKEHQEDILAGSLHPDNQPETVHTYDPTAHSGFLLTRIQALTTAIPKKIHDHAPFGEIMRDFGSLSHYICDLNDPLLLSDADSREPQYRLDFGQYTEKNIDLFPWIFDGHENASLKEDKLQDYVDQTAAEAVRNYTVLGDAYFPNGTLVSSDTFDPRSLPFGIASLSYSHCINDTVQIWFYTWQKSHADTSYTPFYSEKKKPRSQP